MNIITDNSLQRYHNDLMDNYHQNVNSSLPVGSIVAYSNTTIPKNYMLCDGSSLNRVEYADLFAVLSTTYGSDNDTTFKLPDLRNRFIYGSGDSLGTVGGEETHKLTVNEMPEHGHKYNTNWTGNGDQFANVSKVATLNNESNVMTEYTGGDQPHNNMPPYMKLCYIIKVKEDISLETNEILDKLKDSIMSEISLKMHPIGSIYISIDDSDPQTLFGGTWEQIKDKFLLASGDTYANESTGGEAAHTLTIDEMPSHQHKQRGYYNMNPQGGNYVSLGVVASTPQLYNNYMDATGGNQAHNNMPPYIAVNIWKRIA